MLPTVSIVAPPADVGGPGARAMDEACSASVRGGAVCRTLAEGEQPGDDVASARVVWVDAERTNAVVEVRTRGGVRRERRLAFRPRDPLAERWRAIGFAIATLVDEVTEATGASTPPASSTAPPAPPPPASESTSVPPPAPPPDEEIVPPAPHEPRPLFAAASAVAVTGLDGAVVGGIEGRVGAGIDPSVDLVLSGGTSLTGEGSPDSVRGKLAWVAAGARPVLWQKPGWRAFVRVEVVAEQLGLTASRGELHDSATRWLPGGRAAIDIEVPIVGFVGLGASAEVGVRSGPTTVVVAGSDAATLPVLRAGLGIGAVARF